MRPTYVVTLIPDHCSDDAPVIDLGTTTNLRHAFYGAFHAIRGVPSAYASIRSAGERVLEIETNWRGELTEVEFYSPRYRKAVRDRKPGYWMVSQCLNPLWSRWPQGRIRPSDIPAHWHSSV